jgi:hypothetical protein
MKPLGRTAIPLSVLAFVVWLAHGAVDRPEDSSARLLVGLMALTTAISAAVLTRQLLME